MATASHALYGVDVYSDSSEDSGNWESAGPRRSRGYRVEVSAGNATEKDRDAASDSDSDSEDDAMLVALVSAIACRADQPFVFDPRDPIRPDDFVFDSAATADEWGVPEDDDAWEDFFDDEECSASSLSASSEDLEGRKEDLVEISRTRNAARRVTRPAPRFRRAGDSPNKSAKNKNIDAFAATRPSAVGGRWGPPPKRNARASERTKPVKEKEQEPFAGPIPTVRAAVARAMAGALERETAKAERALFSRSPDDSPRLLGTKNQSRRRVRTDSLIAAVADLSSRAEWAHEQAIGYELEGARSRSEYASPEKAEHFSSRRRRAPSSAFAKAPRTSLFAEIASAAAKRDGAGRAESDVSKTRPSDSRAKAVDGSAPPEKEKEKSLEKKATETARLKKPKLDAVSSRARAPFAAKDESSSDESETDAWWTAPFGGVSFAAEKKKKKKTRARTASENEPGLVGLDAMRVAMDRTRPRPSGARGVTKWVKPKPFVSRASPGMEDSFASASSGASGDSAAWWDGRGHRVAKALRRREKTPRTLRGPLAEKSFAPGDGDRDPTRPRVAGPFAWSPPKTSTAKHARNASSSVSARIKLGERFKRKSGPLRGVYAYQTIPSDAFLRRRAPCVVFRPLAARTKRKGVSRRLAERARRRNENAPTFRLLDEDDRSNVSVERNETRNETRGNRASERPEEDLSSPRGSTPGPGAYDVAGATSATRPSAASAPSFAPRSRPAEIRVGSRRDFVHTPDEVPLDLSAEKWRVAAGSRVRQNFPSVSFEKAPPRETETARAFRAALARNAEPSFGEVSARRDARARIAAYESGEALFLDPLARKIASGEIVAPPEPTFALVEASVKRTPSWGLPAFSSRGDVFDDENEVSDFRERDARALASDPLRAWRAAVAPAVKHTPVFVKPRALDTVFEREEDESYVRGPTRAHGAADELARGRALGGGGALPLRYYLGRDEDYASRVASRDLEDEATKPVAYETDATGIGGAPVVASLRVAEALDALRASTPATVFGLAAERWAARERAERKHSAETKRRAEARRVSKESVAETYVAGKAARLLDEHPETEPARLARTALARGAVAARDPGSGSHAWLGIEAARAALAATRPSAPGWTMLPLEVTKPRVAAGRVVEPGDRRALDVRVSLVKTKGFLDGASAFDFARAAGRFHDAADEYSGGSSGHNPRTGPAAYRTEKADALLSRRAPAATFGTAARLPREIKIADEDRTETFSTSEAVSETRVSLDRLVRRRRGVGVNMRLDSNPRFDAETLRLQTEARRFRATRKLEKLVGSSATEGPETGGSARLRKSQSARDGEEFFDPTRDPTRARVPMADFASLTWRVSENAKGRVEMELLEAEIGPGRYDPNDEVTSSRRRAPEADFASAARRFPEEPPDMSLNAEEPPRYSRLLFSRDDVAAAVKAVRPRVAVGGVIPDAGKRDIRAKNEPDAAAPLPPSAVVNLEDALRYLRGARHSSAPDFARAALKPGDEPRTEDARSFADVSASASVAAGGAKGASRGSNVSAFGKPPKTSPTKPADWKSKDPDAFAEGDVLFLLPERALEATRASRFDAPDFAKTLSREMVAKLGTDVTLTADVDFVPEKALRARFPRLDRGTNAVDIGRPRRASSRMDDVSYSERYYADLDAGVYAPRDGDDRRGVLSGQRNAGKSLVNLARAPASERGAFENVARNDGGDALVLDAAAAADGTRPRRDVGAASFARAPRRTGETRASPGGDALVLHPAAVSALDATRGFDFGRAAGRERSAFERARWGEDDVIHALRAEPPTISTLDRSLAKVHAAGVDGRTLAAARRMERRARLEAKMPRRGPGSEAPSRERTDGPVR